MNFCMLPDLPQHTALLLQRAYCGPLHGSVLSSSANICTHTCEGLHHGGVRVLIAVGTQMGILFPMLATCCRCVSCLDPDNEMCCKDQPSWNSTGIATGDLMVCIHMSLMRNLNHTTATPRLRQRQGRTPLSTRMWPCLGAPLSEEIHPGMQGRGEASVSASCLGGLLSPCPRSRRQKSTRWVDSDWHTMGIPELD